MAKTKPSIAGENPQFVEEMEQLGADVLLYLLETYFQDSQSFTVPEIAACLLTPTNVITEALQTLMQLNYIAAQPTERTYSITENGREKLRMMELEEKRIRDVQTLQLRMAAGELFGDVKPNPHTSFVH